MTESAIQHIFHSFAKSATLNLKMNLQQLRGTCQIFIFSFVIFHLVFCYFLPFAVKYYDLASLSPDDHPDSGRGFLFAAVSFCPPRARALFTLSRAGAGSWVVCRRRDWDVPAGPRETALDSDTRVTLCLWLARNSSVIKMRNQLFCEQYQLSESPTSFFIVRCSLR